MRERAGVEIRPMADADLEAVLEIERAGHPTPWPPQVFTDELHREWAWLEVLREPGGRVVAFCNYWLVQDEVHLLNLAVHPERRRQGYGRVFMQHLLDFARQRQCRYVTLEVRKSNAAAIGLYESLGFRAVGVRANYYADSREDAIVMTLDLAG